MLIISEELEQIHQLSFIDRDHINNAQYASFDDIRWHKTRLINHAVIVILPGKIDISYHLKYIKLLSDADIIMLTDEPDRIPKFTRKKVLCLETCITSDFFNGCLATLKNKNMANHSPQFDALQTIRLGKFILEHMSQAATVSRYISQSCGNMPELRRGVFELLTNAFEHGVYNIGFEQKQELISEKNYFSELSSLMRNPEFRDKSVELVLHRKDDGLHININDPGLGFDPRPYLNFNSEFSGATTGRGIAYAANYCFDQLIYRNEGRSVYALIKDIR